MSKNKHKKTISFFAQYGMKEEIKKIERKYQKQRNKSTKSKS